MKCEGGDSATPPTALRCAIVLYYLFRILRYRGRQSGGGGGTMIAKISPQSIKRIFIKDC